MIRDHRDRITTSHSQHLFSTTYLRGDWLIPNKCRTQRISPVRWKPVPNSRALDFVLGSMECEICFELYDNEDRTPLVLACKCRKVMCLCCVTRRLDSTARCPYCDIRWSVRSYINQCRQITPSNMLIQLLDLQKSKGSETPHNEKYSNLGSGELREYYEMSVQNIIRKANENAAEQVPVSVEKIIGMVDETIDELISCQFSHLLLFKHVMTCRLKEIRASRKFCLKNYKGRLKKKQ